MKLEIINTSNYPNAFYVADTEDKINIITVNEMDRSAWEEIVHRVNLHEELIERLKQAYDMLMTQSEGVKYPTILAIEDSIQKANNNH